jgi:hypothetical protein
MIDKARRREIAAEYRQQTPDAGVYLIRCAGMDRALLASSLDLRSERNMLAFAQATGMSGVLYRGLAGCIAEFGLDALSFEVVEVLDIAPSMTPAQIRADLATLEGLWREKLEPGLLS